MSGVIRVSRRAILAGVSEGSAGRDEEVNRLLAGSNFGAGELLAGELSSKMPQRRNVVLIPGVNYRTVKGFLLLLANHTRMAP